MVDSTRIAKLQYEIAPKGFDALDKGFAQLNRNQEAARNRGLALAAAYKQSGKALDESLSSGAIKQQEREWQRTLDTIERYVKELDAADRSTKRLAATSKTVKPQTADDRFGDVSRNVGLFGDVETSLRTIGVGGAVPEIFAVAEALPRLKVALQGIPEQAGLAIQALGVGGVGLAAVLGAVAVGAFALTQAYSQSKEAADKRIKAEQDFIEIIKESTSVEIQEKLKTLALQKEIAELQFKNATDELVGGLEEVLEASNSLDLTIRALARNLDPAAAAASESLTAANEKLNETNTLIDIYTRALGTQEVALNDAAVAMEAMRANSDAFFKLVSDTQINAQVNALNASSESIKQNIAAMTLERNERQRVIEEGLLGADALEEYRKAVTSLNEKIIAAGSTLPAVVLRELQAAYEEHGAALIKIDDDLFTKQAEARKTRDDATSEAERSAGIDRAEAARKANISLEEEQDRHEKALARIQRDYNAARTSAIQDRDVLALQAAKEARRESLRDENDANKERKDSINDALNEQNRAIDMKLAEQKRVIEKRFNEQLTSAQNAANKALEIENAKNAAILAATQTGADQLLAKHQAFWAAANAAPMQGASALPDTPGTPATQSARSLLDNVPLTPIPSRGASGGGGGGGSALSIMFNLGASGRQIELKSREAALRALDNVLREAGF